MIDMSLAITGSAAIARADGGGPEPIVPVFDLGDGVAAWGDSMTYGNGNSFNSYLMWLSAELGGRMHMKATTSAGTTSASGSQMGVSSESTTQFVARQATIDAALATSVDFVIGFGGENDGTGVLASTLISNFVTLTTGTNALALKRQYMLPVPPTKTLKASGTLITRKATVDAFLAKDPTDGDATTGNCWRLNAPNGRFLANVWDDVELTIQVTLTNGSPNVTVVDRMYDPVAGQPIAASSGIPAGTTWLSFDAGTGTGVLSANATASLTLWAAGRDSYDGIHQNVRGAKLMAQNIDAGMVAVGDTWEDGTFYDCGYTGQLNTVSAMAGTGGTFTNMTGQLPTGYVGTNTTGSTVVAAVVVDGGGERWISLTGSGTASANSIVRVRRTITHTFVTGDVFLNAARIKITNAAENGPPVGLKGFAFQSNSNARWITPSYAGGQGLLASAMPIDYVVRSQAIAVAAGAASYTLDIDIQVDLSVSLDWKIQIADLESYNATQSGFA